MSQLRKLNKKTLNHYCLQKTVEDKLHEIDVLLCDLLVQQGYYIDSRPKTGNRQHGVDIHVYDENKILLFIVKQGNITRGVWDGGTNSVYSSLHEIENVYYRTMTPKEKSKEITIIVSTNGFMDGAAYRIFR